MITFDLKDNTVRELNQVLHEDSAANQKFEVNNPGGKHSIAVGNMYPCDITVNGHAGYYCGGMNKEANITINGNAGSGCAENIMSGTVQVKGSASQYCAATGHGGMVIIEGDTAARCGISMKGVDIVVGGAVGHMSGFMAQSGRMVVCGDAGDALGDSCYETRFYVGGEVASLGADCVEKPMQDEHLTELSELLERAGMSDRDVSRFKRYGSARKLYNFNIDHAGEY